MEIKAIGTTKKGDTGFTLMNPDRFFQELSLLQGFIEISIKPIAGKEATVNQKAYFINEVVPAFIYVAKDQGEIYSQSQAIDLLICNAGLNFEYNDLDIANMSLLIDSSKRLLLETFGVSIK